MIVILELLSIEMSLLKKEISKLKWFCLGEKCRIKSFSSLACAPCACVALDFRITQLQKQSIETD
jgi:hypothetical protein